MKRSVDTLSDSHVLTDDQEPPRTMAESVYRRFRQDILWGKFAPGCPLRSDELRKKYDVGISPLREALSRLVSEHLVVALGQRGFRVAPMSEDDVVDTMETRIVLEKEALIRSCKHGDLQWETGLVSAYHALSRISLPSKPGEDAERWSVYHRAFHMALMKGCDSGWMMKLIGLLYDQGERHRILAVARRGHRPTRDPADEHKTITEAALARDSKKAIAALEAHYRNTAKLVVENLRQGSASEQEA